MRRWSKELATLVVLAVVYFVTAKLGLRLASVNPSATPVWAPSGISLAACLILGYRAWPAIYAGAFAANLTTAGTFATSLGIAAGNTLEGILGAYLVNRLANGRRAFERAPDIAAYAGLGALLATTVSPTFGVTSLALGGYADWAHFGSIWATWWLGDATGVLVVGPAVVLWANDPRLHWTRRQPLEAVALLAGLVLVSLAVFGGVIPSRTKDYPLEFLCLPFLVWAAYRFGARATATAVLIIAAVAIRGTLAGVGPFARTSPNESLLLLQAFTGVAAVMGLILAAVVSERRRIEEQLREMAVTDALTGLANYRQLTAVLEGEIRRSQRTERPFAVILFDLDGLKRINDEYGHLVGSRALCRVAVALRLSCRAIDTAARFGGDEFTLVLPESDEPAARRVAARVAERLRDGEEPEVTVSSGIAIYPRDGDGLEKVLAAADQELYRDKALLD